jgi:hypothetical protein
MLKRKKQVLALVLIEDLGFLPLVRETQRLSTRSGTLKPNKVDRDQIQRIIGSYTSPY